MNRWGVQGLFAGLLVVAACAPAGVRQRDPLLPVPVPRPEIEVSADQVPEVVDDLHSLLRFRGRLSDRLDPGEVERSRGSFARMVLVFDLESELEKATVRLAAPYGNLPILRIGEIYRVAWGVSTIDPMGLPDLRVEIRDDEDRLLFVMASGAALPAEPLAPGITLTSGRRPAFFTDFEADASCRVRRRHYATRVQHPSMEAGDAWLMPTDGIVLVSEAGTWRVTVLDNSVALKGGCDKLVAQELAHRTFVLQRVE